ncbi:porin [Sulfuriflexus mobilis]|uniref:porin n=1 Tax=Sulfuriflexus mobilis TaxID=1811807 RepID=UPI000F82E480|nr:porin [Sulfuriflexus mobilis]
MAIGIAAFPLTASADEVSQLKKEMEILKKQVSELRELLITQQKTMASKAEVESVKEEVKEVAKASNEWKIADSAVHLAGYGAIGYTDSERSDGTFNQVTFNPIFHYQYKDLFLLEAELEVAVGEDGETEVGLEYATIDWIINDYAVLVGGKFLSPLGQFRQNLHPTWINKFASAPIGFGHDQAAPLAEVGVQLRGGFPIYNQARGNYGVYVGNGPLIEIDAVEGELEAIEAVGLASNADGEFAWGGRFGILPMAGLEFGISGAWGDVGPEGEEGLLRDYKAYGADFAYQYAAFDLRGEYIQQRVGSKATSVAPDAATWKTWYVQAAYKILPTKWELVARYGDYDSPHDSADQEQWGIGANYLFASNAIAKIGFESNDGKNGETTDDDRFLLQLTYGF